jgi:methionine-S-sulfoxide reductase
MKKTIILAGGCFWCVEHDMREAAGVTAVTSGYSGGGNDLDPTSESADSPTYENHKGYREVICVEYDDTKTSYKKLLQYFIDHIDPTDASGQFADRGDSYKSGIFYENEEERSIAVSVLTELDASHVYDLPHAVEVLPRSVFYIAEEYHQDYAAKNPTHYMLYRTGSGREGFVNKTCAIRDEKHVEWSV